MQNIIDPSFIIVSAEDIIRSQGADPEDYRTRRPRIFQEAVQAAEIGQSLIHPQVWTRQVAVRSVAHEQILLEDQLRLKGELVVQTLAAAKEITFCILTLGEALEVKAHSVMMTDAALGFMIDAYGSLAVERAGEIIEAQISQIACDQGYQSSMAVSPGLIGWPVDQGQSQIFAVLQPDPAQIRLSESFQMIPRKSASFIMGMGEAMVGGNPCDFCTVGGTCKHRKPSETVVQASS